MKGRSRRWRKKGNILVFSAVMMVGMFAMLAFAVDLGCLLVARTQLQVSADAAALAAAQELIDRDNVGGTDNSSQTAAKARLAAAQYAGLNKVMAQSPALADEDVEVGYLANFWDPAAQLSLAAAHRPNAVWVRVQRTAAQNGELPLFFARVLGVQWARSQAEAMAAVINDVSGFRAPPHGGNLDILPFALDLDTWSELLEGNAADDWKWDSKLGRVVPGSDGVREVNLFPQGTGSPGNRGTVNIGVNNNSTAVVARQILYGVTPQDLDFHGGKLELDENGELGLNGNTGISAAVKDQLEAIKGQTRIIPVFDTVVGPGNNAQYTIVKFVGVRIMEVKLTGQMTSKRVIVQPARIVTRGGIPASSPETSHYIYSPVQLVR